MCHKRRYRDELDAKIALERQHLSGHRKPKECQRYYPCQKCRGFHLTSESFEEYTRIKRRYGANA